MPDKLSSNARHDVDLTSFTLAAVTAMAWGMTGVFVRLLPPRHPATITAARLLIALPVAILPGFLSGSRQKLCRNTLARPESYLLATLLAGYYLMATTAFQMAPVADVALLLSTPPLFVLAIEKILGPQPPKAAILGATLAVVGIAVILSPGISLTGNSTLHSFIGRSMALFAAMLTALYAHFYQRLSQKTIILNAKTVTFLTFFIGGLGAGLISFLQPSTMHIEPDFNSIVIFLALGILSTAIPTLGFAVLSNRLPAIMTSTISLFIPLFSGIFAYLLLGERITPMFLLGSVFVLLGVSMIIFRNRFRKRI
ncbi:DMT family transporter [Maridesulfovibrio sp.]|uniref:DMT family transporter n=1 Tax=Maridesulfovibrio sp. TaxID=2795000 RepID=UPI002A186F30|nr:DMT family transporter [Maridesulfovibrio sp.]